MFPILQEFGIVELAALSTPALAILGSIWGVYRLLTTKYANDQEAQKSYADSRVDKLHEKLDVIKQLVEEDIAALHTKVRALELEVATIKGRLDERDRGDSV